MRIAFCVVAAVPFASLPAGPASGPLAIAAAHADDDDDDDDRGGGAVGADGSGRDASGGSRLRPLQLPGFRSFLPRLRSERRAPPRRASRQTPVPVQVANELVALGLDEPSLQSLQSEGYVVLERHTMALTAGDLFRLRIPPGIGLESARERVRLQAPGADIDFNHYYRAEKGDDPICGDTGCALKRHLVGWPSAAPAGTVCTPSLRIGLVDTAINGKHASLAGARLDVLQLGGKSVRPSGAQHGTAVAALLVGAAGSRAPGLIPSSHLFAVDVFRQVTAGADRASAFDLVRALDALADKQTRIVNLSLAGPHNDLLERAVEAMIGPKRAVLIAAVGNAGSRARPQFPAAYEGVIAVTAVDSRRRAYRRAVQGDHVDLAAPGVDVWTAASVAGARTKSGTSFAAPFVTAAAALLLSRDPGMSGAEVAAALARDAHDIGAPGKDAVFGWGLLNVRGLCGKPVADL